MHSNILMATLEIKNRVQEKGKKRTEKEKEWERYLQVHIPRHQAYKAHSNRTFITAKRTRDFTVFIFHMPLPLNLAEATQWTPPIKSTNLPHLVKHAAAETAATTMSFNTLIA